MSEGKSKGKGIRSVAPKRLRLLNAVAIGLWLCALETAATGQQVSNRDILRVEAEDFSESWGGRVLEEKTASGGKSVGYLHLRDTWLSYRLLLMEAGRYGVWARYKCRSGAAEFDVHLGAKRKVARACFPYTGTDPQWHWAKLCALDLPAGRSDLVFQCEIGAAMELDAVILAPEGTIEGSDALLSRLPKANVERQSLPTPGPAQEAKISVWAPVKDLPTRFVSIWLRCGPFPTYLSRLDIPKNSAGIDTDFLAPMGGEVATEPLAHQNLYSKLKDWGGQVEWQGWTAVSCGSPHAGYQPSLLSDETMGYVSLQGSNDPSFPCTGYAATYLRSSSDIRAKFLLGARDAFKLWVNHQLVFSHNPQGEAEAVPDEHVVPVSLRAGKNVVLIKVSRKSYPLPFGAYGFFLRVVGEDGNPVPGLEVGIAEKSPALHVTNLLDTVCVTERNDQRLKWVVLNVINFGPTRTLTLRASVSGTPLPPRTVAMKPGLTPVEIPVPMPREQAAQVKVETVWEGKILDTKEIKVTWPGRYEVFIIPGTHNDYGWFWPAPQCDVELRKIHDEAIKRLLSDPDFAWSMDLTYALKDYVSAYPDMKASIKKLLAEGRLFVSPYWILAPGATYDGESITRKLAFSLGWLRDTFGYRPHTVQEYDIGDLAGQLPQTLRLGGISNYVWNCGDDRPVFYTWEGDDGTRIDTVKGTGYGVGYNTLMARLGERCYGYTESMLLRITRLAQSRDWPEGIVFAPAEMDQTRPCVQATEIAKEWNRRFTSPVMRICTTEQFMDMVRSRKVQPQATEKGEVGPSPPWWQGHLGWVARNDAHNKILARALEAETAWALARALLGSRVPREKFDGLWDAFFYTQDHQFGVVMNEEAAKSHRAYHWKLLLDQLDMARTLRKDALALLARKARTPDGGRGVLVFNPLGWARTEVAAIPNDPSDRSVALRDSEGRPVPAQLSMDGKQVFFSASAPAAGYSVVSVVRSQEATPVFAPRPEHTIENEFYRVQLNAETGCVESILDKELGRELMETGGPLCLDHEQASVSAEVRVERGPVLSRAFVLGRSPGAKQGDQPRLVFRHEITLAAGERAIHIRVRLSGLSSWGVRTHFPLAMKSPEFAYETPYSHVQSLKVIDQRKPTQKWLAACDAEGDFSIVIGTDVGRWMNLGPRFISIRSLPREDEAVCLADRPEVTEHCYVIHSHRGRWSAGAAARWGWEAHHPLAAVRTEKSPGGLPPTVGLVSVAAPNIVISAVGPSPDNDALFLRCYETDGKPADGELTLSHSPTALSEVDLLDSEIRSLPPGARTVRLSLRPHEIKTLKWSAPQPQMNER